MSVFTLSSIRVCVSVRFFLLSKPPGNRVLVATNGEWRQSRPLSLRLDRKHNDNRYKTKGSCNPDFQV